MRLLIYNFSIVYILIEDKILPYNESKTVKLIIMY